MKIICSLILLLPVAAQDFAPKDSERDPILSNLLLNEAEDEPSQRHADADALLVTGSPPPEATLVEEEETSESDNPRPEESEADVSVEPTEETSTKEAHPEPTEVEPKGPRVSVQGGSSTARIGRDQITLKAPFQPKALGSPPPGWRMSEADVVPPIKEEVTLSNGSNVSLTVRPYLLVPNADGDTSFALMEPGFQAAKGYAQTDTIGAVLADSINHADEDLDRLAAASKRLRELLDSLPAETPAPLPAE